MATFWRRQQLYAAFAGAALRYWLTIYPLALREMRRWGRRAKAIPDPVLRTIALDTQRTERGNYEGAAAFSLFAPRRSRAAVIHAAIAFQLAYDYADSLAEQPAPDSVANGRALHEALHAALSPGTPHPDYYSYHAQADDGGYLRALVDACRDTVELLPSWARVAERTRAMSRLVIEFQARNHADTTAVASELAAFARSTPCRGATLSWWEAAAGGASSLVVFSLLAAAARPSLSLHDVEAIEHAYVPWIGSLHVLLDSLIDHPRDLANGHHSLVAHYASSSAMASGMGAIAGAAVHAVRRISLARDHELLLIAMAGLYLSRPAASLPYAAEASSRILDAFGDLASPVLLMHRTRQWIARTDASELNTVEEPGSPRG